MDLSTRVLILVLQCKVKKSVRERVAARVHLNKCVCTEISETGDEIACDEPQYHKGRCKLHYGRWYSVRRTMTPQQQIDFDRELIEAGQLLKDGEAREYRKNDLLTRLAKRIKRA